MSLQEDLNVLMQYEAFARLTKEIVSMREDSIRELQSAEIDRLAQVSGKILAYDEIIGMCDLDLLRKRFPEV
jgi:hypothetical protein|tara:strand:+ start:2834 stop:3049 length:216 start_codon:yes stop_codon:yes gene_type:complete